MEGNSEAIARIGMGRPAFIAELIDYLNANGRLGDSLENQTLPTLYPREVDEEELEASDSDNGKTRERQGRLRRRLCRCAAWSVLSLEAHRRDWRI